MLRDVDLFTVKLGKLDGFGDAGEYLERIVAAKEVESAAREPAKADAAGERAGDESKGEAKDGAGQAAAATPAEGAAKGGGAA